MYMLNTIHTWSQPSADAKEHSQHNLQQKDKVRIFCDNQDFWCIPDVKEHWLFSVWVRLSPVCSAMPNKPLSLYKEKKL